MGFLAMIQYNNEIEQLSVIHGVNANCYLDEGMPCNDTFPPGVPEELPEILQLGIFCCHGRGTGWSLQPNSSFSSHSALISAGVEFKSSHEQLVQGSVLGFGALSLHLAVGWIKGPLRFLQTQSETL